VQQAEPGWQQLIPQQELEQHFASGLQQSSPASASDDNEASDSTNIANNLNFI
jgi:hypothetical protein